MRPAGAIQVDETSSSLTLSWDNRTIAKDRFMGCFFVLFWLVWAPVTFAVTFFVFCRPGGPNLFFALIWLTGGWLGTIGIPYMFLQRRWSESVTMDDSAITLQFFGPLAKKPKILPLGQIKEIAIGRMPGGDGGESVVTLNILCAPPVPFWSRRQMVGYWLSPKHKEELFLAIEAFVRMHDLNVRMTRCQK